MNLPFDRYAFQDLPFDGQAFEQLFTHVKTRSNFPQDISSAQDVYDYLIQNPIKVMVFGSFYRGYNLIEALTRPLTLEDAMVSASSLQDIENLKNFTPSFGFPFLKLVAVATDDPDKTYISRKKRIWNYPEAVDKKDMVPNLVQKLNDGGAAISMTYDRVKTVEFNSFVRGSGAEMALMGTFGQLIDQDRIDLFPAGFFNFHPVGNLQWPHIKDAGPTPFEEMIKRGEPRCWMTMHNVNTKFDDGNLVGMSSFVTVPEEATPVSMHEKSSPLVKQALERFRDNLFQRIEWLLNQEVRRDRVSEPRPGLYLA